MYLDYADVSEGRPKHHFVCLWSRFFCVWYVSDVIHMYMRNWLFERDWSQESQEITNQFDRWETPNSEHVKKCLNTAFMLNFEIWKLH
jgi:hypothetical protein